MVALLSWTGLAVAWGRFMGPLVTIAIVVAVSGALLRSLQISGLLLVVGQLVVLGVVVSVQLTGAPVPVGGDWPRLEAAFEDSLASARQYAAPVPRSVPPIDPILIAAGAACMLVVDVVVGTMHRAPLAGLLLLAICIVPTALVGSGVSWVVFGMTAVGYLLMLYLQESRQIARGGGRGRRGRAPSNGTASTSAPRCGDPRPSRSVGSRRRWRSAHPPSFPTSASTCPAAGSARVAVNRGTSTTR